MMYNHEQWKNVIPDHGSPWSTAGVRDILLQEVALPYCVAAHIEDRGEGNLF